MQALNQTDIYKSKKEAIRFALEYYKELIQQLPQDEARKIVLQKTGIVI